MTLAVGCFLVIDRMLARCVKCGGQRMRCTTHDHVVCYGACYWQGKNAQTPTTVTR